MAIKRVNRNPPVRKKRKFKKLSPHIPSADNISPRVFILGAGFSKPAGIPLGRDLSSQVLQEARLHGGTKFEADIEKFLDYDSARRGKVSTIEDIILEDFLSYLDIEHFLFLRGSKMWSLEGNKTQLLVRNLIFKIIYEAQAKISDKEWKLYDAFVRYLSPNDTIISFNYDTILESCFERNHIHFDLYNGPSLPDGRINLLKMHGSIDWFDISYYNQSVNNFQSNEHYRLPDHPIFGVNYSDYFPKKLVDRNYDPTSELNRIYKIRKLDRYLKLCTDSSTAPMIISPSYHKLVWLNPLREFWYGLERFSANGLVFIGFSFPAHDEYLSFPIVYLTTGYQKRLPISFGPLHSFPPVLFIDYRKGKEDIQSFKDSFCFVDWSKADVFWNGFSLESVKWLSKPRKPLPFS